MTTKQKNLARLSVLGFAILVGSGSFGMRDLLFQSSPAVHVMAVQPRAQPTRAPASESPAVALTQVENSPLIPSQNHKEQVDHSECYQSMMEAAKHPPEIMAPLTQEEILASLFAIPKVEDMYNEFHEVVTLPDGSRALRSAVSEQFEKSLEQLDETGSTGPSIDL